jgi:hypothetical protein
VDAFSFSSSAEGKFASIGIGQVIEKDRAVERTAVAYANASWWVDYWAWDLLAG